MHKNSILILDFGSQYNQLIARRIREMGVYAEIVPYNLSLVEIKKRDPKAIILSGGPASVYGKDSPNISKEIYDIGIPILGICYGMQLITDHMGGKVKKALKKEFGRAKLKINKDKQEIPFLKGVQSDSQIWMSHGDHVTDMPNNFEILGYTENSPIAIMGNINKNIYAVQFHPEVTHSTYGDQLLKNFVFNIANAKANWSMENFVENEVKRIKEKVGNKNVILGLSGGVDSSVAAVLIHKAIGDQLTCIFVDTGLMRKDEAKKVMETYGNHFDINIDMVDAKSRFFDKLEGVTDPEKKRKIIGNEFVEIFDEEAKKIENATFLAQGTIYPDVIESQSVKGPSATIKSHHNVGGLPEEMNLKLLEPLRELFKDEVRKVGRELGIDQEMVDRHPFPGPGLGIRILGAVDREKVEILQNADDIFIKELWKSDLYNKVSQAFVVLLPIKSVGVMGDERTYEYTAVVRSADTTDFMTATWSKLPYDLLERVSNRIINEVEGINRVAYDISSKPPATIEWE
ncbi:MAG: glutamine-hydrolyzing GMP synthase [Fusobacteriota bacterium]